METNGTELPVMNESGVEISSVETHEDPAVQVEDFARAPEMLRETIAAMEDSSATLVETVTAHPLDVVMFEQGAPLGLSKEEVSEALASGGFSEKDALLRDKAQTLYGSFRARLLQAAQIGVATLAIGASTPADAEASKINPEIALQISQTLEEKKTPQTYEEAKARLRESTASEAESFGLFVRKEDGQSYVPTLLKRGTSNLVPLSEEDHAKISEALESNTSDIEMVHTHPINDFTEDVGGLNDEDREILSRGGVPRIAMSPSPVDLEGMASQLSKYPPAQLSGRVIDPAGEWEYGIADSSAPFIEGVRNTYREMDATKTLALTPEERAYLEKLNIENIHPGLLQREISSRAFSDPLARTIMQKMDTMVSHVGKIRANNITAEDDAKFSELEGGFRPWMHPGTPEGDAEIKRREQIASELGFRMKYTPNPVAPKIENINDGVALRASEVIDPTRLDALGSEYPFIDKYGNQLDPNKDSLADGVVTEEEK